MLSLAHYLVLGAILFAISIVGIFLNRKNVIIMLMAIELMLLAVNMNFVAFSHYLGDMHGQIFVFFMLTVAAAEVGDRPRDSGDPVPQPRHDQRRGSRPAQRLNSGKTAMSTTLNENLLLAIPLAPLAGSLIAGLFGQKRRAQGLRIASPSSACMISFVLSRDRLRRRDAAAPVSTATIYEWMTVGPLKMEIGFLVDSLTAMMMVRRDLRLADGAHLHDRLHGRRRRLRALLLLHLALHVLDADARDEQQLPAAVLRLGGGGSGVVPADRLLVHPSDGASTRT